MLITGEEGIGKTLFCYTLFEYYLKKYPVYLGWIECNGKQSIFSIIRNTFEDLRFRRKDKEFIIKGFAGLNKPCILFMDQFDQYTPLDELEELLRCPNVIIILSGTVRKINFIDYYFELLPLSDKNMRKIFEKKSGEEIDFMDSVSRKSVERLLVYANGNPFLTIAFAKAKYHYNGRWDDIWGNMERRAYNEENYLNNILRQLYKIGELDSSDKNALSKLSVIQYKKFVKDVFDWLDISASCIENL